MGAIALAFGVMITGVSRAQTAVDQPKAAVGAPVPAAGFGSLARFIPSDRLILLLENVGLKDHAEAWQKTNASKILTGTPLGSMLELVGAQFIDQMFAADASRKVTGAEIVSLIKHVTQNGWVLAVNSTDKGPRPYRITVVLKGAAGKSMRPVTSRLLGVAMGDIRPRIVRKENRTIIAVDVPAQAAPPPAAPANAAASGAASKPSQAATPPAATAPASPVTWVWWSEQDDLVIGIYPGDEGTLIANAIDGKAPSAAGHPIIAAARKAETGFQPIDIRFLDLAAMGANPGQDWFMNLLGKLKDLSGATRIVQRVGIEDLSLVKRTQLTSSKPHTSALGLFDGPSFKKSAMIPIPEGVHSFATFSMKAERLPELLDHLDPKGDLKGRIQEFMQSLKATSRVNLEKDLLAQIGPKMTLYLSPVRSAAAEDESLSVRSLFSGGLNMTSLMAIARPLIPEATFVAEVKDPVACGKALDAFIIAMNKEIKTRATEAEDVNEEGGRRQGDDEPARGKRGGAGAAGDRAKNRRATDVLAPKFNPLSNTTSIRKFQLYTPTGSKYRLGPSNFRPLIYMDSKYLVISASAGTADVAIEALSKKNWKPTGQMQKSLIIFPEEVLALAVIDSVEATSSLLSSFPGTIQAQINTGIALAKPQPVAPPGAPSGIAPGAAFSPAAGSGVAFRRGMKDADEFDDPRGDGRPRFGAGAAPAAAKPIPQTIQLRVDPEQLPKAEEIKALLFPTTISIARDEDGILITQRSAFPEQIGLESNAMAIGVAMPMIQAARARILTATPPPTASAPNNPAEAFRTGGDPRAGGRRRKDD